MAVNKTFSIDCPAGFLSKLRWEKARLDELDHSDQPAFQYQAINCALNAWHMADWVYHFLPEDVAANFKGESQFREFCRNDFIALRLCREIADCSKHFKLDRRVEQGIRTEKVQFQVEEMELEFWFIEAGDGQSYTLPEVIDSAITYWENFMARYGMLKPAAAGASTVGSSLGPQEPPRDFPNGSVKI